MSQLCSIINVKVAGQLVRATINGQDVKGNVIAKADNGSRFKRSRLPQLD
jgi:hypothetical protein